MVAITMMFSVVALAGNQTFFRSYLANDVKYDSASNTKPNDGDPTLYVTTLKDNGNPQSSSTVFPNGGTLYAKARLVANPNGVYSPTIAFVSNTHKTVTYGAGMARYNQDYILRTEISGCKINRALQWVRWCP